MIICCIMLKQDFSGEINLWFSGAMEIYFYFEFLFSTLKDFNAYIPFLNISLTKENNLAGIFTSEKQLIFSQNK